MSVAATRRPAAPSPAEEGQPRRRRLDARTVRNIVAPVVVFVVFVVLWQAKVFHHLFGLETFAVPLPEDIVNALGDDKRELLKAFGQTFGPAAVGYVGGNLVGFAIAAGMVALPPYAASRASAAGAAFAALPIMAVAPIVALWIESVLWFKAITVTIIVFPSMLVYAYRGMAGVDETALELMSSYRASAWQVFRVLRLPSAIPQVFTALKYTTVLTLVATVICEILKSQDGLGAEIHQSLTSFSTAQAWAAVVLLSVTGIVAYASLQVVERVLFPWALRQEAS
ncbi:MAG TPA: ABC transporter permease subunit [Conexibacter sp.]|jgi:NitT/TauT family transport system permease protein